MPGLIWIVVALGLVAGGGCVGGDDGGGDDAPGGEGNGSAGDGDGNGGAARIDGAMVDCFLDADCDDGVECTVGRCLAGECTYRAVHTRCDDGIFCNGAEQCDPESGCIDGEAPVVPDGVSCTIDECDEELGVVVHLRDDSMCDDGVMCNGIDVCTPDGCMLEPIITDDSIACTVDTCDETNGVLHTADDSLCDDSDDCTSESCDPAAGGCAYVRLCDPQFDSAPVVSGQTPSAAGNGCGTQVTVTGGADVQITAIGVLATFSRAGNMKFLIFEHDSVGEPLVYSSPPKAFGGDVQGATWKVSDPLNFTMLDGRTYAVVGTSDVVVTYQFDASAEVAGGLTSQLKNPNTTSYAAPYVINHGMVDCGIQLFTR